MEDKQLFNNAQNYCKRVIEEAKENYLNQVHYHIIAHMTFGESIKPSQIR